VERERKNLEGWPFFLVDCQSDSLTSFGYQATQCFPTHEEAVAWLGEAPSGPGGAQHPDRGHRDDVQAPSEQEHVTTSGPDTSKEKTELFGVKINTIGKMDKFMLPRNTVEEERSFYIGFSVLFYS
jgi:hypothetical protein